MFLLLALIALFFKAYAVEADIRLLAFYLHLHFPDRKGFALFGMNSQRLDPGTSLVEWRLLSDSTFSVELKKKKEFELFWLTFSHAGRLSACVPK